MLWIVNMLRIYRKHEHNEEREVLKDGTYKGEKYI